MFFKKVKANTPSQRGLLKLNKKKIGLKKVPLLKFKIKGQHNKAGKNNSGKITVFHKGGGNKKKYRVISWNRHKEFEGIVCSLEYDPNRTGFIASVFNTSSKTFFYILAPKNLQVGDFIRSGTDINPSLGSSLLLQNIPLGTPVHNLSLEPGQRPKVSRAAGTFSLLKEKINNKALIELSSENNILVSLKCSAVIGEVSNSYSFLLRHGKAGYSRWKNIRPTVRGVAMNPIDHPHGGGEGKKSGCFKTPWGKVNRKRKIS